MQFWPWGCYRPDRQTEDFLLSKYGRHIWIKNHLLLVVPVTDLIDNFDLFKDLLCDRGIVASSRIVVTEGDLTTVVVLPHNHSINDRHLIFIKENVSTMRNKKI